jgi:hypothetical protein
MTTKELKKQDEKFRYQLLSRMQMDCEYYLDGHQSPNHLWSGNVDDQIRDMKTLYSTFKGEKSPEWISLEEILEYEKNMKKVIDIITPIG